MATDMPRSIIHVDPAHPKQRRHDPRTSFPAVRLVHRARPRDFPPEARQIALHAVAGTLDLSVDSFTASPRRPAAILRREPPTLRS
jgi:hypothetical protein